jgi:hypothetical protein
MIFQVLHSYDPNINTNWQVPMLLKPYELFDDELNQALQVCTCGGETHMQHSSNES